MPVLPREALNIHDTCDKCGVQAKVRASFINGDLFFCGHHARNLNVKQNAFQYEVLDDHFTL